MSKLLEKLKKESARCKAEAESRGGGGYTKVDWFKPKAGDNFIRLLPDKDDPENGLPFKRIYIHYIAVRKKDGSMASNVPVRCLQDFDESCPLCQAYEKALRKAGDDKDARAKARNFKPTERYLYNIANLTEKKIQPFQAPMTVHQEIMEIAEDLGGEIFNIEEGRDLKLIKKEDKSKGNFGTSYRVRAVTKESALPEKLKPLLETMTDLNSLFNENNRKLMLNFLGIDTDDEAEEEDSVDEAIEEADTAERSATKAKKAVKPVKKVVEPEDDDEEEDDEEEDDEPAPRAKKTAKKSDDDDDELDIETDDDEEFDKELRELGVK